MNRWQLENSLREEIMFKVNKEFFLETIGLISMFRKKTNTQATRIKKLEKENEEMREELKNFDKYITQYIKKAEVLYSYNKEQDWEVIYDEPSIPIEVIYDEEATK